MYVCVEYNYNPNTYPMKATVGLFVLFVSLSLCLQAKSKEGSNLIGYWKLIKAETNGVPAPSQMMDRTMEYKDNGLFEGKIFINGQDNPYNAGKFFLANDSTMICIHFTQGEILSKAAFAYNFQIKNDSLHLYGFFFNGVQGSPGFLRMQYINEWWVKPTTLYKK